MQPASSPDDLASDPVDRYWLGANHLVFCRSPSVCGTIHWGTSNADDVREFMRALELARHPALAGGFAVYSDSSTIERVDWQPFSELATFVKDRLPEWAKVITKQAVLVPPGPTGPLLAGMVPIIGMAYPMRFCSGRDLALRQERSSAAPLTGATNTGGVSSNCCW